MDVCGLHTHLGSSRRRLAALWIKYGGNLCSIYMYNMYLQGQLYFCQYKETSEKTTTNDFAITTIMGKIFSVCDFGLYLKGWNRHSYWCSVSWKEGLAPCTGEREGGGGGRTRK